MIRNIANEKCYVGSATNILDRWSNHLQGLRANKHHSIKLQRAWNKYGEDSFDFEIIESIKFEYKSSKIAAEQHYIDFLDSYHNGYNSAPIAGDCTGVKWSAAARKHLSEVKKGKNFRFGYSPSAETREKLRQANLGKRIPEYVKDKLRGRTFSMSEQAKKSISKASGEKNFYNILFKDGTIKTMNYFRDYCRLNNINFKILHQWSKAHNQDKDVHPVFGIKILSLTVIKKH